jgi:hypothetical protein
MLMTLRKQSAQSSAFHICCQELNSDEEKLGLKTIALIGAVHRMELGCRNQSMT